MRIAIFLPSFPVWTETFIINQITGLIDRGFDVDIYARRRREMDSVHAAIEAYGLIGRTRYLQPNLSWSGRLVTFLKLLGGEARWLRGDTWRLLFTTMRDHDPSGGWTRLGVLSLVLPLVGKRPYDVLHCQFGNLGPWLMHIRKIATLEGKLVTSFRGHDVTQERYFASDFYTELFEKGDLFLPVSEKLKDRLVALGCDPGKIRVLHSGIDCSKFPFRERRLHRGETVALVSIARFVEMKGLRYAVDAVSQLVDQGIRIHYTVIGDGELRSELEQQIAELGLSDVVRLVGWRSHEAVTATLEDSHILLAPSVTAANGETEGIPNAVKEAMAMGLPVLSTDHGGIPELVQDGETGYLVPERDSRALAEKLRYLIDHTEDWPSLGRAGRDFVEKEFDIGKLNDLLVEFYRA